MSKKVFLGTACIATCLLLAMGELAAETRQETALSYIELGDRFMHQGDFDRAIGAYNIALQFAPDYVPAFFHRALAYEARGDASKAIADYTSALEIVPALTTALYNRGNQRLNEGDLDGALSDFDKAVASDPPAGKRCILLNLSEYQPVLQSEEHLVIETAEADRFSPGDPLYAMPTHICPTCAMHRQALVVENGQITGRWDIVARDRILTV